MAGIITTSNTPKALWPGVQAWFGRMYNQYPAQWADLFENLQSGMNYEEKVQVTGFGVAPVKAQGTGVSYDSEVQGPTSRFTHVAYGLGYIVTKEEIDDNLYESVATTRASALANSFRQTKERVGAGIFNRAFNSSYTGADGVELISTAHPNTSGGTSSNELTVAADLSESALEDLIIQIMQATDDRGLTISLMPKSLHVAPANWFEANRILKSVYQTDTANNDINALNSTNALPMGAKVNHYFTAPGAWFVKTDCPNSLTHFERVALQFTEDNDFDTENKKYKGYERYSFGWGDYRGVFGSAGA